jgi:hypothetical protein
MSILFLIFLCAFSSISLAEPAPSTQEIPVWWDSFILPAPTLDAVEPLFQSTFPTEDVLVRGPNPPRLPFAEPYQNITNCSQALAQKFDYYGGLNRAQRYCMALDTLRKAKPSRVSYLPQIPWQPDTIPSLLPPMIGTFIGSDLTVCQADAADKLGMSAAEYRKYSPEHRPAYTNTPHPNGRSTMRNTTTWGSAYIGYTIWPLIRGDFNGDGIEDIFIEIYFFIRRNEIAILTRLSPNARMTVLMIDPRIAELLDRSNCAPFVAAFEKAIPQRFKNRVKPK